MAVELDNIHYSFREIDGYNKPFNFVFGPREPGKTTMMWMSKIYNNWKKNFKPWIIMTRSSVEINEAFISSIFDTNINKFTDDNVSPEYTKTSFKDGIVDIKINGKLFFRIVSLNIDLRRIKLAVLKNIAGVFMDEYIIDRSTGEKYLKKEAEKIKEAYTTWRREADGILKMYFVANGYSLYNPLFVYWKVDINKLKKGEFYVGDNFVIHWCTLNPLLKEKLLKENPLYKFDEDYMDYALNGGVMNDKNIRLGTLPKNYHMRFVFRIAGKNLAVYQNQDIFADDDRFFIKCEKSVSMKRQIFAIDIGEMVDRTILLSSEEKFRLNSLISAFRKRLIVFEDVNSYYLFEEIYRQL